MPLDPGSRLGPYEVLALAGIGGMGEVYKARDVRLRRTVALKIIAPALAEDKAARNRLSREARAVAALSHPNIAAIHDVGKSDGQTFLVMEFLEGETLQQRLARGPMGPEEFFTVATQIASGLVAAHREGIIHRDLKPSNVIITRGGVKLFDFGIAKQNAPHGGSISADPTITAPETVAGQLLGTMPYMAPEQLEGKAADARTDIFAFGAVLFEMATGQRAFGGTSHAAVTAAILGERRPSIAHTTPAFPPSVDRLVTTCLARDPDDRWQHSADMLRALQWAHDDIGHAGAGSRSVGRRRWIVHAIWATVLLTAAALAWAAGLRSAAPSFAAANPKPVIVLMDSPLPGRVYDPRTATAGGTNADDVTEALRDLPVVILKENTSALWRREEQVVAENPDLIVTHLSCLFDQRVASAQPDVYEHLFAQAENRLLAFLAYVAAVNPRTRFIVYSRSVFQRHGGEQSWVATQEARFAALNGRLQAFIVPGGRDAATFRDPETAQLLRARVVQSLGLSTTK